MKKFIFPVVCMVLIIFVIKSVNPDLEVVGYVFAGALGLFFGSLINRVAFKEAAEKSEKDSVAK